MNKRSLQFTTFLLLAVAAFEAGAFAAVKKKVPVKKGTPAVHAVAASGKKKSAGTSRVSATRRGKSRSKGASVAQTTWRNRQAAPSSDRYKEIQQALVAKGYLKSTPNGVWDSQSSDALKQFQSEQKLSPTGKINAASLIGLGLGPKHNPGPQPTAQLGGAAAGTVETPLSR